MAEKIRVVRLIKVDELIRLVNLILLSGKIRDNRPVSAMLISDVEMGKTELLDVFSEMSNVVWANDISGKVLVNDILPKAQEGKTHILIPDLLKVLSHTKGVVRNVITTFNSMTEEGVKNILFYGNEKSFPKPVKLGVVFAITKKEFNYRREYFEGVGFVSRCIPITFRYSSQTIDEIHDYIAQGSPVVRKLRITKSPKSMVEISIDPKVEAQLIKILALAKRTGNATGFRTHKHIRTLCKAHAYMSGRKKVVETDIREIEKLLRFMNYDYTEI